MVFIIIICQWLTVNSDLNQTSKNIPGNVHVSDEVKNKSNEAYEKQVAKI